MKILFYFQYGSLKWQNGRNSPVEAVSGDETCQLSFQHNTLPIKPDKNMKRPEVKGLHFLVLLINYS